MKKLQILVIAIALLLFSGCARLADRISAKGSILGSTKSPYIVISQSGGLIMDVYKLPNSIVQSPEGSDGWLFLDQSGNPVYIGGDVKTIRVNDTNSVIWGQYHEYHMEFETLTYTEKFREIIED